MPVKRRALCSVLLTLSIRHVFAHKVRLAIQIETSNEWFRFRIERINHKSMANVQNSLDELDEFNDRHTRFGIENSVTTISVLPFCGVNGSAARK